MASVYQKRGRYFVRWKDAAGQWRRQATACATKREALREAHDLERQAERARHGLEPLPGDGPRLTFGELLDWWRTDYGDKLRSPSMVLFAEKHLRDSLGTLPLGEVTSARLEGLLVAKDGALGPKSLNDLRGLVHRMFSLAIRRGLWAGVNPATAVGRRKVPRRIGEVLRAEEVGPILEALAPRWRPLFACAVWTAMRKGELLGLQKADVDLDAGTITVRRSYDHETTKGGHADVLPIADPLRPFLLEAMLASRSALVFPGPDGKMRPVETALETILRRAMARAGLVERWEHVCRRCKRRGSPHVEQHADAAPRNCPVCDMRLWPRAIVRKVRFHDLRATCATLLARAGVPLVVAQRILRHSDPRLTANVYSRVDLADLRDGVNRIGIHLTPAAEVPVLRLAASAEARLVPAVSPKGPSQESEGPEAAGFLQRTPGPTPVGETGFEPATPWSRTKCSTRLSHSPGNAGVS